MKRILITGMSGTGKSAVIGELRRRAYRAVDLDTPQWSHWADAAPEDHLTPRAGQDWVWREDRVRDLLSRRDGEDLFVSGCATNMSKLFDVIDTIILLSMPLDTLMGRLAARRPGGYGHMADERRKIAELVATIEPLLRRSADHEINTARSVTDAVEDVLTLVKSR
ncbi:AAA family ATPase [Sphingosinicella sp. LHD-64]|uniref:AAA family ATPase n=1 Tax=Sphingosinicella sp. LHD-64 TaxID=3072139 RepID=UPI0028105060|nr:AAA family ATPase [Sphingosinicella sp. LHD-64]MDQ8755148.1 AAA family ATPase [Sphingosinicella sp. LHD-64]